MAKDTATKVQDSAAKSPPFGERATARAVLVGDRIDTAALETGDALSTTPLAFRAGAKGIVVLFRYGVVVFINMEAKEEKEYLRTLRGRISGPFKTREDESATVEVAAEDQIPPGGPIGVKEMSLERLLLVGYALADSVVLAHDEREVSAVFDRIEPFARGLAEHGRTSGGRRTILKHIGNALLVQHRLSGRVAVGEDPDVLWDRPDLERLYSRLKDEYELAERVEGLNNKIAVIAETARALADLMDSERGLRLELMIVLLIVFEIVITLGQMAYGWGSH
jgi:required for meiotic nuclear division protein 1